MTTIQKYILVIFKYIRLYVFPSDSSLNDTFVREARKGSAVKTTPGSEDTCSDSQSSKWCNNLKSHCDCTCSGGSAVATTVASGIKYILYQYW